MSKPRFTREEREKVLEESIRLITEPANWITGQWKCEMYETDKKGNIVYEEDGVTPRRARDLYNRPQSQYCIEGAVHEAMHTVLGKDRAERMGATFDESGDWEGEGLWPTDILGIDDLARKQYPDICEGEEHAALVLNDYHSGSREPEKGHKRILGLLRDSLAEIKSKRKERDAARV